MKITRYAGVEAVTLAPGTPSWGNEQLHGPCAAACVGREDSGDETERYDDSTGMRAHRHE